MMKYFRKKMSFAAIFAVFVFMAGCAEPDFTPVYFAPPDEDGGAKQRPDANIGTRSCTVEFTSKLCVTIKGDSIEAGVKEDDKLCAEVAPFPIHIQGTTAKIKGSEFPDIEFEGGGLPAPIKINGRGDGDGLSNEGSGPVDAIGNMSLDGFSLFVMAVGIAGEISNLTFTTGDLEDLPHLPAISGRPPDSAGAMTLVVGTVLGSIIPAADQYLKGASLQAILTGSISPSISECGGGTAEKSIEIKKVLIDSNGSETSSQLPSDNLMEISRGTYIADSALDVGARFETTEKFRVTNTGSKPVNINISSKIGPFHLNAIKSLAGVLRPGESFVLSVSFKPTMADSSPGENSEFLLIGQDRFTLLGQALNKSGNAEIGIVNDDGAITKPNVGDVAVGESELPANTQRAFFMCREINCGEQKAITGCKDCADPLKHPCELLAISTSGRPMAEVDEACKPAEPDATPMYTIDLKGSSGISLDAKKQVLAIRNKGANDLAIKRVRIDEVQNSKSTGQFAIPQNAIFVAKGFADIAAKAAKALEGEAVRGASFPVVLPPYHEGYDETTMFVVITYQPNDLTGSDGQRAGIGSRATDKAILKIFTDGTPIEMPITGTTTVLESPDLELYFKTTVGIRHLADGNDFSIKGINQETEDLAVPLFLKTSDTASASLRVLSISISGEDAQMFQWLDTKEKIDGVRPDSGKGMRCSIPIIDEKTGEMTGEIFDLNPIPLAQKGFDLSSGAYTLENMPFFGCVNFHRDFGKSPAKNIYQAQIQILSQELDATGNPARNSDGSPKQTSLTAKLRAAINPRSGKMVLRFTQTMAGILNPKFPSLSAITSRLDRYFDKGPEAFSEDDFEVFLGAVVLDPFDEMTITTSDGKKILSTPNDKMTALLRSVDTHPSSNDSDDPFLYDYANMIYDGLRPEGTKGIFEDFPNVPPETRTNGWRIFTGSLSYPGPIVPPGMKSPETPKDCTVINPCSAEGLRRFTKAGIPQGEKGACAFFYASGGRYDSPAFHTKEEIPEGEYENLCNRMDRPQTLNDMDTGYYTVDGRLSFEEVGFRFFGPTYVHNPGGPLGNYPPLDEVFRMGFTTGMIKPSESPDDVNVLPDEKINLTKNEFKINLDDPKMSIPPICKNNTKNRIMMGKEFSTWKYLDGLLFKDKEATVPAGCPENDNNFTGGSAYLKGRDIDHETGIFTIVSSGKFGSSEDLSFAFKDVMMFIILNGWVCDPLGSEENFEGSMCYSIKFNDRDADSQKSLTR